MIVFCQTLINTDSQYVIVQKSGLTYCISALKTAKIMNLSIGQIHNQHWYNLIKREN